MKEELQGSQQHLDGVSRGENEKDTSHIGRSDHVGVCLLLF